MTKEQKKFLISLVNTPARQGLRSLSKNYGIRKFPNSSVKLEKMGGKRSR
jgi:hypothetical protein